MARERWKGVAWWLEIAVEVAVGDVRKGRENREGEGKGWKKRKIESAEKEKRKEGGWGRRGHCCRDRRVVL